MSEQRSALGDSGPEPARTPGRSDLSGPVSAREVAIALGLSERTIRRAIRRGELAATKQGRRYQIAVEEMERYRSQGDRPGLSARPPLTLLTRPAEPARPIPLPT